MNQNRIRQVRLAYLPQIHTFRYRRQDAGVLLPAHFAAVRTRESADVKILLLVLA